MIIYNFNSRLTANRLFLLLLLTSPISAFISFPSFRSGLLLHASKPDNHFPSCDPPFLAVITEPDACENEERLTQTQEVLKQIQEEVDLISVRVDSSSDQDLVVRLIQELVARPSKARIVVTSDWTDAALQGKAHGIHVKESHRSQIPFIRQQFAQAGLLPPLIGTSAHSIDSALEACNQYNPDYLFVGTCYPTQTHPEKSAADLEGPELPGQVANAIGPSYAVLAIGGINKANCVEPVELGATGVATIRAVLQAPNPVQTVATVREAMAKAYKKATSATK